MIVIIIFSYYFVIDKSRQRLGKARLIGTRTPRDRIRHVQLQRMRTSYRMGSRHRLGRLHPVWHTSGFFPTECSYFLRRFFQQPLPSRSSNLRSNNSQEHPPQHRVGPPRARCRLQERAQEGLTFSSFSRPIHPFSYSTAFCSIAPMNLFEHLPIVWDIMACQSVPKVSLTPLYSALP